MQRLFLGSFLSPEQQAAFAHLNAMNSNLGSMWPCQVRWVSSNKLHLTWLFLGQVDGSMVDRLCGLVSRVLSTNQLVEPLSVTYDRLEAWSVRGAPRHIVLTPRQPDRQFLDLAGKLRSGLDGFVAEDSKYQASKAFKPHLTLMRLSPIDGSRIRAPEHSTIDSRHPLRSHQRLQADQLDCSQINGLTSLLPLVQRLDIISLIESHAVDNSHQYRILKNFALSPPH